MNKAELVEKYMQMEYPLEFIEDEDGFCVSIPDLDGCMSEGDSLQEAYDNLMEAKRIWLEVTVENGRTEFPIPYHEQEYSGKILVRLPSSLHCRLVRSAKKEGVSLNSLINHLLSGNLPTIEIMSGIREEGCSMDDSLILKKEPQAPIKIKATRPRRQREVIGPWNHTINIAASRI